MIMILLMNFQEWRMLLTTCWFMSAFVILIGYGDLIQGSDLMTNWSHMPLDFWLVATLHLKSQRTVRLL